MDGRDNGDIGAKVAPDVYKRQPLLSPTVEVEGIPCVDGGVSVSIPYRKPLEEGYGKVVVITTREHGYRKPQTPRALANLYAKY